MLHIRVHDFEDGSRLFSLDFARHLQDLPPQQDLIELLEMPTAMEEPTPTPSQEEPTPAPSQEEPTPTPARAPTRNLRKQHTLLTDALIFKYVDVHGPRWRDLSRSLGGRAFGYGEDVVRNRYIRICDAMGCPYHSTQPRFKKPRKPDHPSERWTLEEDEAMRNAVQEIGVKWGLLAKQFKGKRTAMAIRNRANRLGLCGRDNAGSPQSVPEIL